MNLLENEEQIRKNKNTKIIMGIIIACIVVLMILGAVVLLQIQNVQKNMIKLSIDEKSISKISDSLFLIEDDTVYVSIRDFAELVGYKGYNGDYTSEGLSKGYIQNDNEEASYTLNSNKLYKKILETNDNEYYTLDKPVKIQNDKLYMDLSGVQIATNCAISYDTNNKKFTVYTLPYLVKLYTQKFLDSDLAEESADFSNKKALLYNMVVVRSLDADGKPTGNYGVKSADGTEIIGTKYKSLKFLESTSEFIVETENGKMGILSSKGATKIAPAYDEIKQIDKNLNLYLVKNNNKYGVINQQGNVIIYTEYDQIGVDTTQFESNNIKNQYLLFDYCIPVLRDKKWGFFDKTGKQIVENKYDEIGCVIGTQEGTSNQNLLIIPDYEAIVVGATDAQNNNKKYGLVNSRGEILIGCVLDKLYSVRTSGQDIYYMEQIKNEQTTVRRNVIEWLQQNGKQKPSSSTDNNTENNNNANTNANANTVTSSQGQTSTQNQTSTLPMTNETKPVVKQNRQ